MILKKWFANLNQILQVCIILLTKNYFCLFDSQIQIFNKKIQKVKNIYFWPSACWMCFISTYTVHSRHVQNFHKELSGVLCKYLKKLKKMLTFIFHLLSSKDKLELFCSLKNSSTSFLICLGAQQVAVNLYSIFFIWTKSIANWCFFICLLCFTKGRY